MVRRNIMDQTTKKIIAAAIEVHRHLGPGLPESVYRDCLCRELEEAGLKVERDRDLHIEYKGVQLGGSYPMDLLVAEEAAVVIKATDRVDPVSEARLRTQMKLSRLNRGLIINFYVTTMKHGIICLSRKE